MFHSGHTSYQKKNSVEPYLPTRDENNHHVIHVAAIKCIRMRRHDVLLMTWRLQTSPAENVRHSERHFHNGRLELES